MTNSEAVKVIREALTDARDAINTNYTNCSMNYYADQCEAAITALDSLTIEPSGDAKALLRRIDVECDAINYDDSREAVGYVDLIDAAKLVEADRERVRRECADRACDFIDKEVEA